MPIPGWRLRSSLAASMPSRWNVGGIRMSDTTTWGADAAARGHELVEVGGHADHLEVGLASEQRPTPSRTSRLSSDQDEEGLAALIEPEPLGTEADGAGAGGADHVGLLRRCTSRKMAAFGQLQERRRRAERLFDCFSTASAASLDSMISLMMRAHAMTPSEDLLVKDLGEDVGAELMPRQARRSAKPCRPQRLPGCVDEEPAPTCAIRRAHTPAAGTVPRQAGVRGSFRHRSRTAATRSTRSRTAACLGEVNRNTRRKAPALAT